MWLIVEALTWEWTRLALHCTQQFMQLDLMWSALSTSTRPQEPRWARFRFRLRPCPVPPPLPKGKQVGPLSHRSASFWRAESLLVCLQVWFCFNQSPSSLGYYLNGQTVNWVLSLKMCMSYMRVLSHKGPDLLTGSHKTFSIFCWFCKAQFVKVFWNIWNFPSISVQRKWLQVSSASLECFGRVTFSVHILVIF